MNPAGRFSSLAGRHQLKHRLGESLADQDEEPVLTEVVIAPDLPPKRGPGNMLHLAQRRGGAPAAAAKVTA